MKRINKIGPAILGGFATPPLLDITHLDALLTSSVSIVDTRPADQFAAGLIPNAINIPFNKSFNTWAGWLLPYSADVYLIADASDVEAMVRDLAMIGIDRVAGYFSTDIVREWRAAGRTLDTIAQRTPADVAAMTADSEVTVLDVRGASEYEAGHLPGVRNIPVGYLTEHLDELPRETPLVLHCQGGARSAIAASVLRANGFANVLNMTGGFAAWEGAGLPTERGAAGAAVVAAL
jgi:hydroxyacylglutathione hydrolase